MNRFTVASTLALLLALAVPAAASADTVSFVSTGAEQTFTVPAGVSSIHVVSIGGRGGISTDGFGARVSGDLAVSPGQVLFVEVAGNGSATGSRLGGFNGGANGGTNNGSGGGGASDLRTVSSSLGGSLSSRLIVAAGGGGGAGASGGPYGGEGGAAGADGAVGAGATQHGDGGKAGTGSSGGAAGGPNGTAGTLGGGGAGGSDNSGLGGGGGGGGYYGGGGGGSGVSDNRGGGGGGGSSFTGTASNATVGADTAGTASITISYTPSATGPGPSATGPGGGDNTIAAASGLAFSNSTFAAESSGPSATNAKTKAPRGTKVSFKLNQAATVRFTVTRRLKGRKSKRGKKTVCVKPTKKNRKKKSCTRVVTLKGSFSRNGATGTNSFHFTGRLNGRKLKPGRYKLVATPTAGGLKGKATSTGFRIVR